MDGLRSLQKVVSDTGVGRSLLLPWARGAVHGFPRPVFLCTCPVVSRADCFYAPDAPDPHRQVLPGPGTKVPGRMGGRVSSGSRGPSRHRRTGSVVTRKGAKEERSCPRSLLSSLTSCPGPWGRRWGGRDSVRGIGPGGWVIVTPGVDDSGCGRLRVWTGPGG